MFPEERREKICELVNERKTVRVSELRDLLDASEVTIRRDLEELHKKNMLVRTHGGAVASYSVGQEASAVDFTGRYETARRSFWMVRVPCMNW